MGQKQDAAHRLGRTVFTMTVAEPPAEPRRVRVDGWGSLPLHVLTWAGDNTKIGGWMKKGRWRGMPIFSVTLEERATCPTSCPLWRGCYGDNMPFAIRWKAGWDVMHAIEADLVHLDAAFPEGYVVRLHVLGDFFSTAYVAFWQRMVREHDCRVYGYTHRQPGTAIGDAVTQFAVDNPERVAIMRSDPVSGTDPLPGCVVIPSAATEPHPTTQVICPNETGRTESCGSCGLCMNGRTSVSFLDHSRAAIAARRRKPLPVVT